MIFTPLSLAGTWTVAPEPHRDRRGFFARTWCADEFAAHGLDPRVAQCSISYNERKGTLRGLHLQDRPHGEVKLVRCVRGAIYDVIVDLRPGSDTFLRHATVELNSDNRLSLYIPEGVAHGFQTLVDDTEVWYQMSALYAPDFTRGVRWNDPLFGISWPHLPPIIIERDSAFPDFLPAEA